MHDALKRYILVCLAVCTAISYAHAQPKSLGTSFSLSGIGIAYEHHLDQECFINAGLQAEMLPVFIDRTNSPGVSVAVSCNFIIKEWTSRNNNVISMFAGPGVTAGMAHDFRKDFGYFLGLKGRLGAECRFDRNISISLSLNPVIGSHVILRDGYMEMKYYKIGLIETLIPEICISYSFR